MSQEFKIRSVIDLDAQKAQQVLKDFKEGSEKLKDIKINFKVDGLEKVEGKMKELIKLAEELRKIQSDVRTGGSSSGAKQLKEEIEALNRYKDTYRTIQKLKQQQSKGLNDESFTRTEKEIQRLNEEMRGFRDTIQSVQGLGKLQLFDDAQENAGLARMEGSINKLSEKAEKLKNNFNDIEFKHADTGTMEAEINTIVQEVERLQTLAVSGVDLNMDIGRALGELAEVEARFRGLRDIEINALRNADADARRLNQELARGSAFMNDFRGSFVSFTLGNIAGDFIADGIRGITSAFGDLDKGMTNIKKVAKDSEVDSTGELKNIQHTAIETAQAVGQSSADVMNAIADTLQAGIGNMQTSMDVAKQVMMFANVGELDQETTSSAVNTMIKGFKIDPVKKFNQEINGTKREVTGLENAMDLLNFAS